MCGDACRERRRNRLARRRRHEDLDEQRADERARQQKRREAAKAGKCHELASDAKGSELLRKLQEIVDRAARLSRATFRRDAMRILRRIGPAGPVKVDRVGGRHELACALDAGENGSRSVVDVDSVTDRHGAG